MKYKVLSGGDIAFWLIPRVSVAEHLQCKGMQRMQPCEQMQSSSSLYLTKWELILITEEGFDSMALAQGLIMRYSIAVISIDNDSESLRRDSNLAAKSSDSNMPVKAHHNRFYHETKGKDGELFAYLVMVFSLVEDAKVTTMSYSPCPFLA